MTNCKNCNNCAWFCHADGKCYVPKGIYVSGRLIPFNVNFACCQDWTSDGLEDWEREEHTLVTMENA